MTKGPTRSPDEETPSTSSGENVPQEEVSAGPHASPIRALRRMSLLRQTGSHQNDVSQQGASPPTVARDYSPFRRIYERLTSDPPLFGNQSRGDSSSRSSLGQSGSRGGASSRTLSRDHGPYQGNWERTGSRLTPSFSSISLLDNSHRPPLQRRSGAPRNASPLGASLQSASFRSDSPASPDNSPTRTPLQQQIGSLLIVSQASPDSSPPSASGEFSHRNVSPDNSPPRASRRAPLQQLSGSHQNVSPVYSPPRASRRAPLQQLSGSHQNVSPDYSPPRASRRAPLQQLSGSLQNVPQQDASSVGPWPRGASSVRAWPRGAVRRGTSRRGPRRHNSRPNSRLRLDCKAHVMTLNKEFKFAVDCLKSVLRGYSPKWNATISAPIDDRHRDRLCTPNIRRAILHLVGEELAGRIDAFFDLTFNGIHLPLYFQMLLQMLTTEFCNNPYATRKFLNFCCEVAEISALMYITGYRQAPSYGVMCIFYATKCSMERNSFDEDFDMWGELDCMARRLNDKYRSCDPAPAMYHHRRKVLSSFDIVYDPDE